MVGLDLGTSLLKFVLSENGSVAAFGAHELPYGCVVDGKILDPVSFVKVLSGVVDRHGLLKKDVAISLPASAVLVKKLTLPVSSEDEIELMIEESLDEYIPFSSSEVYWDFQVLGINPSDDRYEDVLLVITKMDYVDYIVDLVAASGLNPKVVEPFHFSSYNAVSGDGFDKVCIVDMGYSSTKIFIFDKGYPVVHRELESPKGDEEKGDPSRLKKKAIQMLKVLESLFPGPIGGEDAGFFISGGLSSDGMRAMLSEGLGVEFRFPEIPVVDDPRLYMAAFGASTWGVRS